MASNYLPQREFRKGDLVYVLTTGRWEISAVDRDRYSPEFCYGPAFLTLAEGQLLGIYPPAEIGDAKTYDAAELHRKVQHLENRITALSETLDKLRLHT